jgi:hypothetical protein
LEERVSVVWYYSIPPQYRFDGVEKGLRPDRFQSAAIIQEPPPVSVIQRFLLNIAFRRQHLTQDQLAAKIARLNIGKPGQKKNRKPPPPQPDLQLPTMGFGELDDNTKSVQDLW